jgi:hypothetical protein
MDEAEYENVGDSVTFTRGAGYGSVPAWSVPPSQLSPSPLNSTDTFWESIQASATTRVVLPDGVADLDQAARRFLNTLTAEQLTHLDQVCGDEVLSPRGGLQRSCLDTNDLVRHLMVPLLSQAITALSDHLPITDVAQAEFSSDRAALPDRVLGSHASALPLLTRQTARPEDDRKAGLPSLHEVHAAGKRSGVLPRPAKGRDATGLHSFLLIPASEAGKTFGEEAQRAVAELHLVNVAGQADLMFCREQSGLGVADLGRILQPCRAAYVDLSTVPQSSPHSRFDIQDWTPLDP